ncbi:hypothetical protein LWI29_027042 [Acer saccharum]|uniref:Uncharacterized protein n=1 Tax=Acer saccharum TaxID=4024 RepID=A0AA39VYC1_ACESA|nr:hypothetical protein LWI29_027042 [Acer saccharum]
MGNCLHHAPSPSPSPSSSSSSPIQWGGDDWGSSSISDHDYISDCDNNVKSGGGGGDFRVSSSTKTTTTIEVKIKITKKQLEELLGRAELKQLSVQQVQLAQLMNVSD